MPNLGVIAAFGLLTVSSGMTGSSLTSTNLNAIPYYYEANSYFNGDSSICSSSSLAKQAVGDIISSDKKADFVQKHEKINVNLQITKISKHISNFEFEEEYEEI